METKTTIRKMLSGNYISVPKYQRAYSWDTDKQVEQFLDDIDNDIASNSKTPYYFGHFIFENDGSNEYYIIDGQQRLTTIEIFLSAVFNRLESLKKECGITLTVDEIKIKEDTLKSNSNRCRFSTVEYDNQFFKDFIVDKPIFINRKSVKKNFETVSSKKIAEAYKYFLNHLKNKDCSDCEKYIDCVVNSICTTHIIHKKAEAIRMFVFQNDRGKRPTKLEIFKARFMYEIQISSTLKEEDKTEKIIELQKCFENIYRAIATIENNINEDDVLSYALRVYYNSLKIDISTENIDKELSQKATAIPFIIDFTSELANSFDCLKLFFEEKDSYKIYSLALLGKTQAIPFVIKAYEYGISDTEKEELFAALESIVLRHKIIKTRAHIEDRLNDVFSKFTEENRDISPIINHIMWLKKADEESWGWWCYWSDDKLKFELQGKIDHTIAKHLLWKYENYLLFQKKSGYKFMPMSRIVNPQLEHIAPQTPTDGSPVAAGYDTYDEVFINKYLDCLGNYLLVSKSHNCSIGNVPFKEKRNSYTALEQQREVQEMTNDKAVWKRGKIKTRNKKIVEFILEEL
ncbi:MAG: DUF262 domain-containing protein [Salinivirgaceae bacterium]|nr:DUF262 domain-containing protein [Salinivirgaceae bacterium]